MATDFLNKAAFLKLAAERIRGELENAGARGVKICAATKTQPPEIINLLPELGITVAGENRVQEFLEKADKVRGIEWHFIGRLQRNKVKYIVDRVTLIHSLDSMDLAAEIERCCIKKGVGKIGALIEINMGEAQKGGVPFEIALDFYREVIKNCPHINVKGLMAVMPAGATDELYLRLKAIYDIIKAEAGGGFSILSAGMSNDYLIAVKYGANLIRPGSALFGRRPAPHKN